MTNVLARWSRRFSRLTSVETRPLPRPAGSRPGKKFDAGTVSATITYFQRLRRLQPFCQSVESARILEVTLRLFDAVFTIRVSDLKDGTLLSAVQLIITGLCIMDYD